MVISYLHLNLPDDPTASGLLTDVPCTLPSYMPSHHRACYTVTVTR